MSDKEHPNYTEFEQKRADATGKNTQKDPPPPKQRDHLNAGVN